MKVRKTSAVPPDVEALSLSVLVSGLGEDFTE
jgi:hypothetical protein